MRNVDPEFNKEVNNYKDLNKKNNEHYLTEREKWFKQEGNYKGKDYYQFKDIARIDWENKKEAKLERESQEKIRKMVDKAAKEHPLYNKSYIQLAEVSVNSLYDKPIKIETIQMGKKAVDDVCNAVRVEAISEQKHHL